MNETRGVDCCDQTRDSQTAAERPELEQAHKFYANIRTMRSPESIHASRMVEINKWRERESCCLEAESRNSDGYKWTCTLGG